jgi:hypothetical protein
MADHGFGPAAAVEAGGWSVLTASETGAAHRNTAQPNQDAVAACRPGPGRVAVAVADGHGHSRHFRSERGARLAVAAACQAFRDLSRWLDGWAGTPPRDAASAAAGLRDVLVPAITGRWRRAVREDLAAEPFTPSERSRQAGDDALVAYGTTLLVAAAWRETLLLAQIGDGDIVCVRPDGRALLPVPADPRLDGYHTTSLCMAEAEHAFRVSILDLSRTPLVAVMLTTDGYGHAQAADAWEDAVSADLARLVASQAPDWLAGQLPRWASQCASAEGSADDTTIALLLAPRQDASSAVTAGLP